MAGVINDGIRVLLENGLVEFLIFALIFAVAYGILQHVQLFGTDEENETKKYNAVIAAVLGALSIVPHFVAPNSVYDIVPIVEKALPQSMLLLVVVLSVLILLGMFGFSSSIIKDYAWIVGLVLLGVVAWIFIAAAPFGWRIPNWLDKDIIAVVVALAVFGGVVAWIMKGSEEVEGE